MSFPLRLTALSLALAFPALFLAARPAMPAAPGNPALPAAATAQPAAREVREYRGERLDPYDRDYDNSIRGPQKVDPVTYRLRLDGLVEQPLSLTYDEVLALPRVERLLTLNCVEGWSERLLFAGVRLGDLLGRARPRPGATTVIFHAVDGYSSSLPLSYVRRIDLMLASRVNGLDLDHQRGFPFQAVAETKYGYKWVKWVTRIELSDKEHLGYWETKGYDNDATVGR